MPTLAADDALADLFCAHSTPRRSIRSFEVVVVDNSGSERAHSSGARVRILVNERNVGFGSAINQAIRDTQTPYIAVLNDDADTSCGMAGGAGEGGAAEARPKAGMFASQVRMSDTSNLDSAEPSASRARRIRAAPEGARRGAGVFRGR